MYQISVTSAGCDSRMHTTSPVLDTHASRAEVHVQSNYMSIPFADLFRIGGGDMCVEGVSGLARSVLVC